MSFLFYYKGSSSDTHLQLARDGEENRHTGSRLSLSVVLDGPVPAPCRYFLLGTCIKHVWDCHGGRNEVENKQTINTFLRRLVYGNIDGNVGEKRKEETRSVDWGGSEFEILKWNNKLPVTLESDPVSTF